MIELTKHRSWDVYTRLRCLVASHALLKNVATSLVHHFIKALATSSVISTYHQLLRLGNMECLIFPDGLVKDFRGSYAEELGIDLCCTNQVEIQE